MEKKWWKSKQLNRLIASLDSMMRNKKGQFQGMKVGGITFWQTADRNYVKVRDTKRGKDNFMPYARFIMEKKLGRKLKQREIVHHINEIKTDDHIENLRLMSLSEHMSLHRKGSDNSVACIASAKKRENDRKLLSPKVEDLLSKGYNLTDIIDELEVGYHMLKKIIKENDFKYSNNTSKKVRKHIPEITRLSNCGFSGRRISRLVPVSLPTIHKIIREVRKNGESMV